MSDSHIIARESDIGHHAVYISHGRSSCNHQIGLSAERADVSLKIGTVGRYILCRPFLWLWLFSNTQYSMQPKIIIKH